MCWSTEEAAVVKRSKTLWLKRNSSSFFSNSVIPRWVGRHTSSQGSRLARWLCPCRWFLAIRKEERSPGQAFCFKLCMSLLLTSHWPKLSHVATAHFKKGWEIWSPTRQPCPQLNCGLEKEVVLLLKERESDSWGQFSSLYHSGHPDS